MPGSPLRGALRGAPSRGSAPGSIRAAAAVVLFGLGALGGALWTERPTGSAPTPPPSALALSDEPIRVAAGGAVDPSLFDEVRTLEHALLADSTRLDPETRRVIAANLETIDRAIRESVAALEADPGSRYLQGHLGSALHRKVGYLQSVTRLLES